MKRRAWFTRSPAPVLAVALVLLWLLPDVVAWLTRRPDDAWARVQASGAIRFATEASYPPFEGVGGDGVFYGLDVDVAREVAQRLGVQAVFINVGIDGLYDVLRVGQAEASISALPIDPARLGRWAYSRPYFDAGLVLVTREGAALGELPGHTLAVVLGSTGDARLRYYQRRAAGIGALPVATPADALAAVTDGRADAAIVDGVVARQLLATRFAALRVAAPLTHEPYAVAVWGESAELRAAIDRALEAMQLDGALDRIVKRWIEK